MIRSIRILSLIIPVFIIISLITGCNEADKYLSQMKLTPQQKEQTRPIFTKYLEKQNKILESMQDHGPENSSRSPENTMQRTERPQRPDRSKMENEMKKRKEALDTQFEDNDQFTASELAEVLDSEQIEIFLKVAKQLRNEKIIEMMSSQSGQNNGSNGRMGGHGGPPGGGMGSGRGMNGF